MLHGTEKSMHTLCNWFFIVVVVKHAHYKMKPLSTPTKVYQDDFTPAQGNALQAAVASIFGLSLQDVPNFIVMKEGLIRVLSIFTSSMDDVSRLNSE